MPWVPLHSPEIEARPRDRHLPGQRARSVPGAWPRRRAARCFWLAAIAAAALTPAARADLIEVRLVAIDPRGADQAVLFLAEPQGKKVLPISVSQDQAESIYRAQSGVHPPRPLTHELLVSVIEALGAKLSRVDITDLRENTYFAVLSLDSAGKVVHMDARPSDAIALAVRVKAPIYAEEGLLVPLGGGGRPSVETHPLLSSLGLHLQELTGELARFFEVPGGGGVLVAEAASGGTAARSGVERGDVIRRVGGEEVRTVTEALAALRAAREHGKPVHIQVVRDGHERSLRLEW
jgi:bifunctional DNase/RNase